MTVCGKIGRFFYLMIVDFKLYFVHNHITSGNQKFGSYWYLFFFIFDIISLIEHAYINLKFHHKQSQYWLISPLSTGYDSFRKIMKFEFIYLFRSEFYPLDFFFSDFIIRDVCKKTFPQRIIFMITSLWTSV